MRSEYISKVDTLSFNTFNPPDTLAAITEASGGTLLLKAYDIAGVEATVTLDGTGGSDWSNGAGGVGIHTVTIDPADFVAGTRYRLTLEDAEVGGESIDGITIMEIKIAPQEVDLVKVGGADITSGTPDVNVVTVDAAAKEEISAEIMDDLAAAIAKLEAIHDKLPVTNIADNYTLDDLSSLVNRRLTADRAGYLDKLNVSGTLATSAEIMADLAATIAKLDALYARFYNKVSKTATDIIVYNTDGVTPLTTQAYTEGTTDTVNAPTV